jgi:hypothetical protein
MISPHSNNADIGHHSNTVSVNNHSNTLTLQKVGIYTTGYFISFYQILEKHQEV